MFKVYAVTDVGQEREQNQDGFLLDGVRCVNDLHREVYYESSSDNIHVAVCDGVGSTQYATYAVNKTIEFISNHIFIKDEAELEKMIIDMNAYVYRSAKDDYKEDSACTIAGVYINKDYAYIYNIGDSRVYSINNGYLELLTLDDTGAALFGENSTYKEGDFQFKPPLVQSIGTNELIDLVHIKKTQGENTFILCSDGITDMLTIDEMEEIVSYSDSMMDVAQRLVYEANNKGGYDNSTVILLVDEEE